MTNISEPVGAEALSEIFGIDWDSDIMAYEEPHFFKSAANRIKPVVPDDER